MSSRSELTKHLTAVEPSGGAKPVTIFDRLEGQQDQFVKAMQNEAGAQRLIRIIATEIRRNPKLGECTDVSLLGAAMMCAQVNLEPGHLGQVYLIPRRNRRLETPKTGEVHEVNWQLGYKGMIELALRTDKVGSLVASEVREGDEFEEEQGYNPVFRHRPKRGPDRGDAYLYYSYASLTNGVPMAPTVLEMDEIYEARSLSDAYKWAETGPKAKGGGKKDSVWHMFEPAMAKKTAVRRHWNYLPKSYEMVDAYQADDAVITIEDPDRIRADELNVEREDVLTTGDETPEIDAGPVTIHPAPEAETPVEPWDKPAPGQPDEAVDVEETAGELSIDDLIDIAREHGKIVKTAKPSTATKVMQALAKDATGKEWGVLEDLSQTERAKIAEHLKAPAEAS